MENLIQGTERIGPHSAQRTEFEARAEIALRRVRAILVRLHPHLACAECVVECDETLVQIDMALALSPTRRMAS